MRPLTIRSAVAVAPLLALVAAVVLVTACGESPDPELPAPPAPAERAATLPDVPPVPLAERAAYALERLMRGPQPPRGLIVPHLHRQNLALAAADLVDLAPYARKLLADPKLVERVVGMARRNADPWHNILYVLLALPDKPAETVVAWTAPVLALGPEAPRSSLQLEAVRVLAAVDDAAAAPILLRLLELGAHRREVATVAFPALVRQGSPWTERALETAYRSGGPSLWGQASGSLGAGETLGNVDRHKADDLAWWAALAEGSGPPPPENPPRLKHHAWCAARLWLDASVARTGAGGAAYGPAPSVVTHGTGWYVAPTSEQAVFATYGYAFDGKQPAAAARCALARWGYAPYRAAVRRDLTTEAKEPRDASLYYAGVHCLVELESREARETCKQDLAILLASGEPPSVQRSMAMNRLISWLPSAEDPEVWALLEQVLSKARPLDVYRAPLEQAYDAMASHPRARTAVIREMLLRGDEDPESSGVALHLVRQSADPVYGPTLEALLDRDPHGPQAGTYRRILLYIHGRRTDLTPAAAATIVTRLRRWLDDVPPLPEQEAAAVASSLLDLGEPGARAFAAELKGPRRQAFLRAWPPSREPVALFVAQAALAPLGPDTSPGEMQQVLALAYQCFPDTAAPALEALRLRAAAGHRPWVEVALERVRHRAPRS